MNRYLPPVLILLLLIAFRILGSAFPDTLPNFQPLSALFFCGALLAAGSRSWLIPLIAWLITYPVPALISGNTSWMGPETIFGTAIAFAATYLLGNKLRRSGFGTLLIGSAAAALVFHLITNGLAWAASPIYPKSPQGIIQSLWTGPVGSPVPSWLFLRNMLAANLIFTSIFLSARFSLPSFRPSPAPQPSR